MKLVFFFFKLFNKIYLNLTYNFNNVKSLNPNHNLKKKLIISLTAKKTRFSSLHLVLASIFNQTIHPDEMILWIDKKEKKFLKKNILDFCSKGLQIRYCKNLRSYNKIYYLLNNRSRYIITFDDDIIYNKESVFFLLKKLKQFGNNFVIANRVHYIKYKNNIIEKYNKWIWNSDKKKPSIFNFQTGVYGVLYPPNCFYKEVNKVYKFKKLSPYADDIWLYWMIRLNKKKVIWSGFNYKNYSLINLETKSLHKLNVGLNQNDIQISNMIKEYGFPLK